MAAKLNQIIAVVSGKKKQTDAALTEIYHKLQSKGDLFNGLTRTYKATADDGETLPSEIKLPQVNTKDAITAAKTVLKDLIDVVAVQDNTNTIAKADVVVDDKVIIADVPVTYLLFLEKQLENIGAFVSKLPTLDPGERWEFSAEQDCYVTKPNVTNRNVKTPRVLIKVAATDKFPAQVDVYNEDVKAGEWTNVKLSTCIDVKQRNEFQGRVRKLIDAVKFAREQANSIETVKVEYADDLLSYIFS